MINEINKCLKENLAYSRKRKRELNSFILNGQYEQAETMLNWVGSLDLIHRETNEFVLSVRNLLSINGGYKNKINKFQELQGKIKKYKCEAKLNRRSFDSSTNKIESLEIDLAQKMELLVETQALLKKNDSDMANKVDSLRNANARIKALTSELEISNRKIEALEQDKKSN